MSETVIVTTESTLREIVSQAVAAAVADLKTQPELIDTQTLASRMGVARDTVRKWVSRDGCPCIRAGKNRLRFREGDVLAWHEQRNAI